MTTDGSDKQVDLSGNQMGLSFGPYLETIRIEKGVRLEEVARQTRVGIDVLRLIEEEDLENLPQEVFVLGFIRAYAKTIGADGDIAVRLYRNKVFTEHETVKTDMALNRMGRRFWLHLVAIVLILGVIIGGALVAERYWNKETSPVAVEPLQDAASTDPSVPKVVPLASDAAVASTAIVNDPASAKQLLKINTLKETWMRVTIDELPAKEYNLGPGDQMVLEAQKGFQLVIGNVGGVDISLNGKPVQVSGKAGQSVKLKIP